jgi:hypothetical protein
MASPPRRRLRLRYSCAKECLASLGGILSVAWLACRLADGAGVPNTSVAAPPRRLDEWPQDEPDGESGAPPRHLSWLGIDWVPPIEMNPAGGGPPTLYAGANYTRWELISSSEVMGGGRLLMVWPDVDPSAALAGHCPMYTYIDTLTPLDGQALIPNSTAGFSAVWTNGLQFSQGGVFKLCFSPQGTFDIGDGNIVPYDTATYRVYGAMDTCNHGPGCLMARRFFCHAPHSNYVHYGPVGTQCHIFMQTTNSPLLYSRLTWMAGEYCGLSVGPGMTQWNQTWARIVDPLSLIYLGHTRHDLQEGFRYRICFCPSFDAGGDGVCGEPSDFVQQVGYLDGLVTSYLDVRSDVVIQVLPMTRFSIKVDCGSGPWCGAHDMARIKVIRKAWNTIPTNVDLAFWNSENL